MNDKMQTGRMLLSEKIQHANGISHSRAMSKVDGMRDTKVEKNLNSIGIYWMAHENRWLSDNRNRHILR